MTTRTITGTLVGRPRASVLFRQRATFVSGSATYLATTYAATADTSGDFSIDLPVPDSGSILYRVELPDGAAADVYLGAGSATTLELLLAGAFAASGSPDLLAVLEELIDDHAATIASTTVLGHVKIDGTTITIDGSGVISSSGGGGGGGGSPSGPAGGVLAGTYPNPSFASDMATQAELDAEASTRAAADTTNAGNLTTHAALTTSAHGGIVASNDSRLTDARTPTAHASTHASAGSDPLTLAQSQITGLTAALAALQPLDSDLTAIAALSTTSFGRGLLALADAAALRTTAGLGTAALVDTGTGAANVPTITQADARYQPLDSDLTAIAALSTTSYGRSLLAAADAAALRTLAGLGSLATASSITASQISDASANGQSLITAANYAAMRTLLTLVVGTDVQAYDAELAALAGLTSAAGKIPYFTGSGTAGTIDAGTLGGREGPHLHGGLTWSLDPANAANTNAPTAGVVFYQKHYTPIAITVASVTIYVATGGSGLTNCYFGIYDSAGNRQGLTADMSASLTGSAVAVTGALTGTVNIAAGSTFYTALLFNGTTPALQRGGGGLADNAGLVAANGYRFWSSGAGLTALPSSVTVSGGTIQTQSYFTMTK